MAGKTGNPIDALNEKKGVMGSAIVTRDGMVLVGDLPSSIHNETFAIMCATMFGAAHTVNSDLDIGSPDMIVVDAKRGSLVIANAGKRELLAVILEEDYAVTEFVDIIQKAIDDFKSI